MLPGTTLPHSTQHSRIRSMLHDILGTLLGINTTDIDDDSTFLELGAESLQLLQVAQGVQDTFGVKIPFRLLIEKYATVNDLSDHLEQHLGPEVSPAPVPAPAAMQQALVLPVALPAQSQVSPALPAQIEPLAAAHHQGRPKDTEFVERLFAQQLQIMAQQIELLQGRRAHQPATAAKPTSTPAPQLAAQPAAPVPAAPTATKSASQPEFVAYQPIQKGARGSLTEQQQQHIEALTQRLTTRMRRSKEHTQDHRAYLADNRVVTGFRLFWKELCYPLVIDHGQGGRIWDIDGNEYVDLTMGFGSLLFGHSPDFVVEALKQEVSRGMRLGPQSYLAGKVAKALCELTNSERAAFCNSGTEAIMTALRVARAVTGRSLVAIFAGSFHGTFDGTLIRGEEQPDGLLKAVPMAPGIVPNMVKDVLLLRYNDPKSLELIQAHGHELAAVLIEPPRSRRPDLRSSEFVGELRRITAEHGTALIFDEIVTGFRTHPGGVQALFGIQADMVTYGKAIAGGMPIGILAGKAHYLDAIDGGMWQYGDESFPEADTTFFAGTFCKHPLSMTAAFAVLNYLTEQGPQLQERLSERTTQLAETLNAFFTAEQVPIQVVHFGSLFRLIYPPELRYMDVFFFHLLEYGVYIWEGRNCFLCTNHTEADIEQIIHGIKLSIAAMRSGGFLPPSPNDSSSGSTPGSSAPSTPRQEQQSSSLATASAKSTAAVRRSPMNEAQKQLWFLAHLDQQASVAYHLSMVFKLHGALDRDALFAALQQVVARHDALRTTFSPQGDDQYVADELILTLPLMEVSHLEPQMRQEQTDLWLRDEARQPFDLERGPLIRTALLKFDDTTHLLAITAHHLISDGQSLGTIVHEISDLYAAQVAGATLDLKPATQYSAYIAWEAQQLQSSALGSAESYWLERFASPPLVLTLPTDRPRPSVQTFAGTRAIVTFDADLRSAVQRLGKAHNSTPFVVLLAGFFTLLHRLSNQNEVVIGVPVAGQAAMGASQLVGYCVNMLPLSSHIRQRATVADYLPTVRNALLDAYEHQIYPFNRLIKKLNLPRDASRPPLVSVVFNLDHTSPISSFGPLAADLVSNPTHAVQFDLDVNVVDTGSSLVVECDYNSDLFDAATIERWLGYYGTLLMGMATDAYQPLNSLALLNEAERHQILVEWNATQAAYPDQACFYELFEAQAARTPNRIAVVHGTVSLTYRDLNATANRLARALIDRGVQRDQVVGILAERSQHFLITMLAIFKAGGAYLPLDPLYPAQRIAQSLEQSRTPLVLTAIEFEPLLLRATHDLPVEWRPKIGLLDSLLSEAHSSDNLPKRSDASDLAYVIYTSGSTGIPKGAMVTQRGMINHLYAKLVALRLTGNDRVAQTASQCFDISVWQFLVALLNGGQVHILDDTIAHNPAVLLDQIEQSKISILEIVPSLLRLMLQEIARLKDRQPALASLRWLVSTGEALPPEIARQWLQSYPRIPLMNAYGPTECSDDVTHQPITEPPLEQISYLPIGRPVINTQLYVLDAYLEPVPIGVHGELHVGGAGVGLGYLHDPARTALVFIPDPFSAIPGARLYKTGDLARLLADGTIEFLGRVDHQVKIRGFRIELGDIEAILRQHPAIRDIAMMARQDEGTELRLVAYLVPRAMPGPSIAEIRAFLKDRLPEYMIPAAFVLLEELPLTANGKIDRQALPAPERDRAALGKEFVPPLTPLEKQLATIWSQVLALPKVGVEDNFFELGGDSILSIQVIARANEIGIQLTPRQIFQYQTIAELSRVATINQTSAKNQAEQGTVTGDVALTPIQRWFFEQDFTAPHHFNLSTLQEVHEPIDAVLLERTFQHIIAHHDALRLRFSNQDGTWRQINAKQELDFSLVKVDLSLLPEAEQAAALAQEAAPLQASLNLQTGPIIRAALFHLGAGQPDRLFVTVHHLAMDLFSWNILLDHIQIIYRQLKQGEPTQLPAKTTSYKQWAQHLTDYAQSAVLRKELHYWRKQIPMQIDRLPIDRANGRAANTEDSEQELKLSLNVEETQTLLQEVPKIYHAKINEVLLMALAQSFSRWTSDSKLLIDLEGHGREALFDAVNLTRTIGWFTSVYPVVLAPDAQLNAGETLRKIKEQIREIPDGGIGYGILRYLCTDAEVVADMRALPQAEVCFNYLGQIDRTADKRSIFVPAAERPGSDRSTHGPRLYLIDVRAWVRDGQLTLSWNYSQNVHHVATIEQLAQECMRALRSLIAQSQLPETAEASPSDFGLTQIDQTQFDSLLSKIKFT